MKSNDKLTKTTIKNSFLKDLLVGDDLSESSFKPLNGQGHGQIARAYFSYLVTRLFNCPRLPGYSDGLGYSGVTDRELRKMTQKFSEADIQSHLAELERIYIHTQAELKKFSDEDWVLLRRGFQKNEAETVSCAVRYAKVNQRQQVTIRANSFDFYAFMPCSGFDDGVSIIRKVPKEDIILSHKTVEGFSEIDADVLVLNRDPRGFITLKLDDFVDDLPRKVPEAVFRKYCEAMEHGNNGYYGQPCLDMVFERVFASPVRYFPSKSPTIQMKSGIFRNKLIVDWK